jgi:hypothetical protein
VGFADLDSDGRVELLVANAPSGGGNLSVFRWTSGVTFTGPTFYALPVGPTALATRDINGDGRVDAVVTCNGPHVVAPLLNNGAGGFTGGPSTALPAGANPRAIALADVNADGRTPSPCSPATARVASPSAPPTGRTTGRGPSRSAT